MPDITKVPALANGQRPESGPMQFGDDWPGVFIRGDEALFMARYLDQALQHRTPPDYLMKMLEGLRDTLRSCSVGDTGWPP